MGLFATLVREMSCEVSLSMRAFNRMGTGVKKIAKSPRPYDRNAYFGWSRRKNPLDGKPNLQCNRNIAGLLGELKCSCASVQRSLIVTAETCHLRTTF